LGALLKLPAAMAAAGAGAGGAGLSSGAAELATLIPVCVVKTRRFLRWDETLAKKSLRTMDLATRFRVAAVTADILPLTTAEDVSPSDAPSSRAVP